MQCKSLWIKASAKCINVNVNVKYQLYTKWPTFGFQPLKFVIFNNLILDMEPHWGPHISGTEYCMALKIKIPKEKFINN